MEDDEILRLIRSCPEWTGRPFTTAKELAERAGMTRQGMHSRLQSLVDEGRIRKYEAGGAIYWCEESAQQPDAYESDISAR